MPKQSSTAEFGPNLKSLECFRTIIEQGSATAAARHLQLTQPAISRQLRLLEEATGFELFKRAKGRLIPTAEALTFYKEVDVALQSVDRVIDLAKNLRNADFGELSIVSPPSLAESILPQVISEFLKAHPNVHVSLESESVETAKDMVALRAVDCGFIKLPAERAGLECRPLIASGTVCAVPRKHRLASKRRINVKDLDGEPLILLGRGRTSRQLIDDAFDAAGVRMNVRIETHTVGAACAFVSRGTGIAVMNEMLALHYANRQTILKRFSPNVPHEYAFMTSRDAPMTRVTQRFFESCLEHFEKNKGAFRLSGSK